MKNEDEDYDLFAFAAKLRQEQLFINSERIDIMHLNKLIKNKIHIVNKASWLTNKQRLLLFERGLSYQNCQKFDFIHNSEFVEARHILGFQNAMKIANLLQILRSQPKQLAKWLVAGESLAEDGVQYTLILQSVLNGLYGGCIFAEDTKFLLSLFLELAKQQLLKTDNPRRIIQQRSCSFRHLYYLFNEIYQPAKFFLSAALEIPILELISFSDYFLDIDVDKTMMRFSQGELVEGYKDAVQFRNDVASKIAHFTNSLIRSLLENVYSFPKALAWITCQIYKIIEKNFCTKEANAVTTELIFTLFICPAILDPEQYGILNTQINEQARHNLIQIGKMLQILALHKFEDVDLKHFDIFENLDKEGIAKFLELLFENMDCPEAPVGSSPMVPRDIMLFTEEELNNMVCFLQKVHTNCDNFEKNPALSVSIEEHLSSLTVSSTDNSPKMQRPNGDNISPFSKKQAFFSLSSIGKTPTRRLPEERRTNTNVVIVFPIDGVAFEPIGLLPEEKVIDLSVPVKNDSGVFDGSEISKDNLVIAGEPSTVASSELKTNYSGYADEGSIGNTSDNLEAISEAASNHSVASSLELENEEDQNDNLSDMVSANVSGRGTPNISGRDTPSSQVNENEERPNVDNRQENVTQPQQNISRQIRSEIDDKFCKFEIKKLLEGDETISIISETWSTDVLASDTETVDAGESRAERQHQLHLVDQAIQEVPLAEHVLDISETQSESAWSTDVAASDTERLTEVDNDDAASVAQSDDTNSVARSDDTRSETDEAASARRLSSCSSTFGSASGNGAQNYVANVAVNSTSYVAVSVNSPGYASASSLYKSTEANFVSINHNYITGATFHEYKRSDGRQNGKIETDGNANTVFKTPTLFFNLKTNLSGKTGEGGMTAGPSGLMQKGSLADADGESTLVKTGGITKKYGDRPTEILLSNCSLNSSSSGSSSNSFENKASANESSEQWDSKPWLNSSGSSLNVTLTPSESTSELSVLSVNNLVNPGAIKKSTTPGRSLKPSASTGAIPKSISFDTSVEKGLDDDSKSRRGKFFDKIKNGFRNKKRSFRNQDDLRDGELTDAASKRGMSESPARVNSDSSEDILAKYRSKGFAESSPVKENGSVKKLVKSPGTDNLDAETNSLSDIKKKLRLVLANTAEIPLYLKKYPRSVKSKLETLLRLELGKARKLLEWSQMARVSEAVRCVNLLDESSCAKLLQSMRADISVRSAYIQYLMSSKQELLFCDMYLTTLHEQIKHDRWQCEIYFAAQCVREFVVEQEQVIAEFCDEFHQLSLADEKCDSLQAFYKRLYALAHEKRHWQEVLQRRGQMIKNVLERHIMARVYTQALYPNGDGDRDRDRVLSEHIRNLSRVITPDHKYLDIPKMYQRESPWIPAQEALRVLDIARTPMEKLKCVVTCAKCIMNLLGLSQTGGSATADDFTPVLVYVIIQVNPGALLSTIQFVNSFQGQIVGEEGYWWTQFCSAVEYIKTMDYGD
ncbi:hypothetical protein GWI33_016591 [Rhynchophorus ferrugineus]|uniref:Receptor-mediated endocytosis protein 6 homolog n=1 Tax=Rhynchophorus ferrugineus TaxID=354439 RepID=A0A834I1D6_RHYFE|nr:hypothetical protein GWI33_016591 [Rhynchophorus ferrugineus]